MSDTTAPANPSSPKIGAESPPPGEQAALDKLRELHLKVHQASPGPRLRGEHAKHHGGLWATFHVEDGIPKEYRFGLFQRPRAMRALIRFSNGRVFDDRKPDLRGLAIKVFSAESEETNPINQDFILANQPIFFARDVEHLLDFLQETAKGTPPATLVDRFPKLVGFSTTTSVSPLSLSYWSQTPYRLGSGAVKYFVQPSVLQDQLQPGLALADSENCLREVMVEQISRRKIGVLFDFCVTPQTDATTMPIEDPSVEWTSPSIKLATIRVYPQEFDSPERQAFVENCAWSPWNGLPEHQPLGGINRARRPVYSESQELRHRTNSVPSSIPTGRE